MNQSNKALRDEVAGMIAKINERRWHEQWVERRSKEEADELIPHYSKSRVLLGYLLKPVQDEKPNYRKMTKAELVKILEAQP